MERAELRSDLANVRAALRPLRLLRAAMALNSGSDARGERAGATQTWLPRVMWLLKRTRWAATLLAGLPTVGRWLRRRRRLAAAAALLAAAIATWRAVRPDDAPN